MSERIGLAIQFGNGHDSAKVAGMNKVTNEEEFETQVNPEGGSPKLTLTLRPNRTIAV
jgi:hypothetical protein